VETIIIFTK